MLSASLNKTFPSFLPLKINFIYVTSRHVSRPAAGVCQTGCGRGVRWREWSLSASSSAKTISVEIPERQPYWNVDAM